MIIAIYTRKSLYSDKSDSVESQYKICEQYCSMHYQDYQIIKYTDEGYTGANTKRPDFEKMCEAVNKGVINLVICYKIDRISRNVSDFSRFFDRLTAKNVDFISVKEQIDTSTPLGRAMMYICTVFAQMERETIAERVRDSMVEMAKSGKWCAGNPPVGYERKRTVIDGKKHTIIQVNEVGKEYYLRLVRLFKSGLSLTGVATRCRHIGITSVNGKYLSASQIWDLLRNPVYCCADERAYEYFKNLGCRMALPKSSFDGEHGIAPYGRTCQIGGTHRAVPPSDWIISVGFHEPLLSSEEWISIQKRFGQNRLSKTFTLQRGILKGVLRCKCGCLMRVTHKIDHQYHKEYTSYVCGKKARQGITACNICKRVDVDLIDNEVYKVLESIVIKKDELDNYLKKPVPVKDNSKVIKSSMASVETRIDNLTRSLSETADTDVSRVILNQIATLTRQQKDLQTQLVECKSNENELKDFEQYKEEVYETITKDFKNFKSWSYTEKNEFMKRVLKSATYDGKTLELSF